MNCYNVIFEIHHGVKKNEPLGLVHRMITRYQPVQMLQMNILNVVPHMRNAFEGTSSQGSYEQLEFVRIVVVRYLFDEFELDFFTVRFARIFLEGCLEYSTNIRGFLGQFLV